MALFLVGILITGASTWMITQIRTLRVQISKTGRADTSIKMDFITESSWNKPLVRGDEERKSWDTLNPQ